MSDITIKLPGFDQLAEAAKDLIQKVIVPPLEEVGSLFADQIKLFRFKNQVGIILKAEEYLRKKNIKTKKVSLKVLAPFLEDCSLEEDEDLKEKWAALLVNIVKEDSPIDNSLYSIILSQLSPKDARVFEYIFQLSTRKGSPSITSIEKLKTIITRDQLEQMHPNVNLSVDNLIRLGLLKNQAISDTDVMITDLGISFVINCMLP